MNKRNKALQLALNDKLEVIVYPLEVETSYLSQSDTTDLPTLDRKRDSIINKSETEIDSGSMPYPSYILHSSHIKNMPIGWLILSVADFTQEVPDLVLKIAQTINSAMGGIFTEIPDFINFLRNSPARKDMPTEANLLDTANAIRESGRLFPVRYNHALRGYEEIIPKPFYNCYQYGVALLTKALAIPKEQLTIELEKCTELVTRVAVNEKCYEHCTKINCDALTTVGIFPIESLLMSKDSESFQASLKKTQGSIASKVTEVLKPFPMAALVSHRNIDTRIKQYTKSISEQVSHVLSLHSEIGIQSAIRVSGKQNSKRSEAAYASAKFKREKCVNCMINVNTCKARTFCEGPFLDDPNQILEKFRNYILASGIPTPGPDSAIDKIQNKLISNYNSRNLFLGPLAVKTWGYPVLTYIPRTLNPPPIFILDVGERYSSTILSVIPRWDKDKEMPGFPRWRLQKINEDAFSHKIKYMERGKFGFRTNLDYKLTVNGEDLSNYYTLVHFKRGKALLAVSLGFSAQYFRGFEALLENLSACPEPITPYSELDKLVLQLTRIPSYYSMWRSDSRAFTRFANSAYSYTHNYNYREKGISRYHLPVSVQYLSNTGHYKSGYRLIQASLQKGHVCSIIPPMQTPHTSRGIALTEALRKTWPTLF